MSKSDLKSGAAAPTPMRRSTAFCAAAFFLFIVTLASHKCMHHSSIATTTALQCEQVDPLFPVPDAKLDEGLRRIKTDAFALEAAERLAVAVRIPTQSYDDMKANATVFTDPRYAPFVEIRDAIEKSFPLVHRDLERVIVNGFSLVHIWKGSPSKKKPLLLAAHLDVVPVNQETESQWTHPPFSGYIDAKERVIWGRGTSDTKNSLLAVYEAVEELIRAGFVPKRDVILAFGHDEEISGFGGAQEIAKYLIEQRGLKGGIEMVIDEGLGFMEYGGRLFATVNTAEKGYVDAKISVNVPGGHSSMPPDHTGIGMLSNIVEDLEEHPYVPALPDNSAFLQFLQCAAAYSPGMDPYLRWAIRNIYWARQSVVNQVYRESDLRYRYAMTTSQAADIVQGGVKVNALPESSSVIINHRVAIHSKVADVVEHLVEIAGREADAFNLTVEVVDHNSGKVWNVPESRNGAAFGTIKIEMLEGALEPAPISPSYGSKQWDVLAGTIRAVYETDTEEDLVVTPNVNLGGNTDTRHYWGLTKHIYRFCPSKKQINIHTVDERISVEDHRQAIEFYYQLIRNADRL
ncbi:hypothetical protein BJ742DRAFT_830665 [Cladochytrium replicatum]|nr:hypothetical protein BJ742DRAFT_830665 [Cladochytrium replicatum]